MNDPHDSRYAQNGASSNSPNSSNGSCDGFVANEPAANGAVRRALGALFRFRRRALAFFLVSAAIVAAGLVVVPREYTSEAKLLVRIGRSSVKLDPTVTTSAVVGVEASRETEINSVLEIINSRSILEQVIDEVGPGAPYRSDYERDKAIDKLQKKLAIWSPKLSNVVAVEYQADSPQRAQRTLNSVIEVFQREHLKAYSTNGSYEFFEQQRTAIKAQLDGALAALRDAKNEYALASVDGRRATLEQQIGDVEKQLIDNSARFKSSQARLAALESGLGELPAPVIKQFVQGLPDDAASNMRRQLYDLQTRELELLSKFTADHPQIVAIREQVRDAEKILAAEQPDRGQATSAALLTESSNAKALAAERESLGGHHRRLNDELKQLNQQDVRIAELSRQVALLEDNYRTYSDNLEQARIDQELNQDEITNISVFQPASFSSVPSSPKIVLTLVLGLAAAFCGAIALALLSERLDTSLRCSLQIERQLGLPVFVSLPDLSPRTLMSASAE